MKYTKNAWVLAVLALGLASCRKEEAVVAGAETDAAPVVAEVPGELYGAELTLTESTPIADLFTDELVGQRVRVEGTIVDVVMPGRPRPWRGLRAGP